jgi:hypothetical protein
MEGDWLPPQAPGSTPPPSAPPDAPPPPPAFEAEPAPNTEAVAAMTCAVAGAGAIYWTNGLSSLVSLILGIVAVVYARKARRNVERGGPVKHADLTTAANIAGWITVGVSAVATLGWLVAVLVWDAL